LTKYRLYCLNDAGKFSKALDIDAGSDEDAIEYARELKLSVKCELWERGRMVAKLEPGRAA
jgi:hypothetical protein